MCNLEGVKQWLLYQLLLFVIYTDVLLDCLENIE